ACPVTNSSAPVTGPARERRAARHSLLGGLERIFWVATGAAAAVAIMHRTSPAPANLQPVSHNSFVTKSVAQSGTIADKPVVKEEEIALSDEGVRFVQADTPVKKVRRVLMERQSWPVPQNGGTVEIEWPRQDYLFVPVSQQ